MSLTILLSILGIHMNDDRTYILAELAQAFGLTERAARYYIEKTLAPSRFTISLINYLHIA